MSAGEPAQAKCHLLPRAYSVAQRVDSWPDVAKHRWASTIRLFRGNDRPCVLERRGESNMGNCCECASMRTDTGHIRKPDAARHPVLCVTRALRALLRAGLRVAQNDDAHSSAGRIPKRPPSTASHRHQNRIGDPDVQYASGATLAKFVVKNALVVKVSDGDTFTAKYIDSSGSSVTCRVRVFAIDCPELSQNFGKEAKELCEKMLLNQYVTLMVRGNDRYGRIVAEVITKSGLNFGQEMLLAGAAWHFTAYDKTEALSALEQHARTHRRGLWAYPRPQQPWLYRKRRRERESHGADK